MDLTLDVGEEYWTPENRSNTRPTIGYAMPFTHGFYESLTYVRIQDVSLSYDIPRKLLDMLKINGLRLYISAKNLATFTNWSGWDPESGNTPMPRIFTFGIDVTL